MKQEDQQRAFFAELDVLIGRFRREFDLSYGSAVGALQMMIVLLTQEAIEDEEGD